MYYHWAVLPDIYTYQHGESREAALQIPGEQDSIPVRAAWLDRVHQYEQAAELDSQP